MIESRELESQQSRASALSKLTASRYGNACTSNNNNLPSLVQHTKKPVELFLFSWFYYARSQV